MIRWTVTADWWLIAGVVGLAAVGALVLLIDTCAMLVDIFVRRSRRR